MISSELNAEEIGDFCADGDTSFGKTDGNAAAPVGQADIVYAVAKAVLFHDGHDVRA